MVANIDMLAMGFLISSLFSLLIFPLALSLRRVLTPCNRINHSPIELSIGRRWACYY